MTARTSDHAGSCQCSGWRPASATVPDRTFKRILVGRLRRITFGLNLKGRDSGSSGSGSSQISLRDQAHWQPNLNVKFKFRCPVCQWPAGNLSGRRLHATTRLVAAAWAARRGLRAAIMARPRLRLGCLAPPPLPAPLAELSGPPAWASPALRPWARPPLSVAPESPPADRAPWPHGPEFKLATGTPAAWGWQCRGLRRGRPRGGCIRRRRGKLTRARISSATGTGPWPAAAVFKFAQPPLPPALPVPPSAPAQALARAAVHGWPGPGGSSLLQVLCRARTGSGDKAPRLPWAVQLLSNVL
jgi:hypothetical protein